MVLFLKLLILLWSVNFAPPLCAHILEDRWNRPLDGFCNLPDGKPLFGNHKTIRGVLAGILAGTLVGLALDFPWWVGMGTGALSMAGDLYSSFLKRRLSFVSGDVVPGLDQLPEGIFPFLILAPFFSLSFVYALLCVAVFGIGAYFGSVFLNRVLLGIPSKSYPRRLRSKTRFRELISCQVTQSPLKYLLNFEDAVYYHVFMKTAFKIMGIYELGRKNALNIEKREIIFSFPDLPPAFDNFKILMLTDLHLDGVDGLTERLMGIVRQIPVDLCILGGDFRMEIYGSFAEAQLRLRKLLPSIRAADGIIGILGNHDCLEIVDSLKEDGITFLVNSSMRLERNGDHLWLAGVDDPHYYRSHNLDQAFDGIPRGAFSIFLAHSNEVYREALQHGPRLYLCGHCHAGQIQIPPFGPVFTHSTAPRYMCNGPWRYENMHGYTSGGVGVSGVPVRFNSKGEVTVITLRRA
jgi:uncharacterized protein